MKQRFSRRTSAARRRSPWDRVLRARVGYAASAALLALFAVASPAATNSCTSEGNWRKGDQVTIRANVADTADGWKVTKRVYMAKHSNDTHVETNNTHNENTTLEKDYKKLWGGRSLQAYNNVAGTNPMVNSFETTFQATNGTTVVCSVKFHGTDAGNSSYQFKSVSCSGPNSGKEYVSCERQYGAGVERFRVWLTLNDLE